jgi:hypothetical protein
VRRRDQPLPASVTSTTEARARGQVERRRQHREAIRA